MFGATLADCPRRKAGWERWRPSPIYAAALLTLQRRGMRDVQKRSTTRGGRDGQMTATETAQWVIDQALQLFGGRACVVVRSPRRCIGRSAPCESMKAQPLIKLIIGRELMKSS